MVEEAKATLRMTDQLTTIRSSLSNVYTQIFKILFLIMKK
jgi:hypothetical protein